MDKICTTDQNSFTKPRSLWQQLNSFSKTTKTKMEIIVSKSWNKCALCGHYNKYDNMVEEKEFIKTKENKSEQF